MTRIGARAGTRLVKSGSSVRVFVMAGQSNMLGADAVIDQATKDKDLVQALKQSVADESSLFVQGGHFTTAWGPIRGHSITYLGEPLYQGNQVKGHGPEVGLSRALGGGIACVKFSMNYSALSGGRSPWVSGGPLWAAWQAFVDSSLASLGRPYTIAAFCWTQGIDDGLLHRSQTDYRTDLTQIAADLRAKFGNAPFITARSINSAAVGSSFMAPIRAAQLEVGALAGNAWIDLDDLTPYVNTHHMTAANQLRHGERFAAAYKALGGA